MYNQITEIYKLFNYYNFRLLNYNLINNSIKLEFINLYNNCDKFSIIFEKEKIYTIIPLKLNNSCYRTNTNNINNTLNYLRNHLYLYSIQI